VSLPWRDPLTIWLSPGEVSVTRRNFGLRGFGERVSVVHPEPSTQPRVWRAAVDALAKSLEASPGRTPRARVVLSNHFVRYVVARWRDDIQSISERQAFVHHCFRETYGAAADGWTLREDPEDHGKASLACAIDADLLEALREVFRGAHMRVASVQPLLMAAFNRHRHEIGDTGALFVYEKGRLCSACFEKAEWRSVSNARVEGAEMLGIALEREMVLHGLAEDALSYLCIVDDCEPQVSRPLKILERRTSESGQPAALAPEVSA
jgi:hypothetical protein